MQTPLITTTGTTPYTAGNSARAITSDFETFLLMLTAQIRNQDPLSPVEASDYAVQLATFSSVEQQVLTNELLRDLSQQFDTGGLSQMGTWIEQEVRVAAPVWFAGAPVEVIRPQSTLLAESAVLVVSDPAGQEIQRLALPRGDGPVEWAGMSSDGAPLPVGIYHLEIETTNSEGGTNSTQVEVYARVTELRLGDDGPRLVLSGGVEVPPTAVTALRRG